MPFSSLFDWGMLIIILENFRILYSSAFWKGFSFMCYNFSGLTSDIPSWMNWVPSFYYPCMSPFSLGLLELSCDWVLQYYLSLLLSSKRYARTQSLIVTMLSSPVARFQGSNKTNDRKRYSSINIVGNYLLLTHAIRITLYLVWPKWCLIS